MAEEKILKRSEVPEEYTWNLKDMFESDEAWLAEFEALKAYPEIVAKYHDMLVSLDLGLEDRLSAKVGLLSGGQRQALTLLMATIKKPQLLLLDEHTAALDPKTAKTVLEMTNKVVTENNLTTLMVTHNMNDAIKYGNRLIMMDHGHVILDIGGEEKKNLKVSDLLAKFEEVSGKEFSNDRMMLAK